MLSYHPIYDPFHCVFRLLVVGDALKTNNILIDKVSLIDFFYLFPKQLAKVTLPKPYIQLKKTIMSLPVQYEYLNNMVRIYSELREIQEVAFGIMLSKGLLDYPSFEQDVFTFTIDNLTPQIKTACEREFKTKAWIAPVVKFIEETELNGPHGIRSRTGLGEYRYDRSSK